MQFVNWPALLVAIMLRSHCAIITNCHKRRRNFKFLCAFSNSGYTREFTMRRMFDSQTCFNSNRDLCARAGLKLRKFVSNKVEVLECLPESDRATSKSFDIHTNSLPLYDTH